MRAAAGALPGFVEPLGFGVHAVDTGFGRERFDAAYLIVDAGRAAFVDTGPNAAVPRLLAALEALGVAPDAVDHVIPTHVHLDHAGGVGRLMRELPNATCWVHPRGLRHLADPSALVAGATEVYGEAEMARAYGRIEPVAADRLRASADGLTLDWAGRRLEFLDAPGHARHHHVVWDPASRGWFTGDTFGLSYPELSAPDGRRFVTPTATPVQFEPGPLAESIRRMLARSPRTMYLTHYGAIGDGDGDVARLGAELLAQLDALVALGERVDRLDLAPDARTAALHDALRAFYRDALAAHGVADVDAGLARLDVDVDLNAQGLAVWLDRRRRDAARAAAGPGAAR